MSISMFDASVPRFVHMLKNLDAILDKGEAYAQVKKLAPEVLPASRLFPDMFPLSRQIQIATDIAKGAVARLAGIDIPCFEDTEQTMDELKERLAKTIAFMESVSADQIIGTEEKDISFTGGGHNMAFKGKAYLIDFVLPNFYFHIVTAYNIQRHNGVEIGKMDYVG